MAEDTFEEEAAPDEGEANEQEQETESVPSRPKPARSKTAKKPSGKKKGKAMPDKPDKKKRKVASTRSRVSDDTKITIKAKKNPCRAGSNSHKFFQVVMKSKTVGEYRKKAAGIEGSAMGYLAFFKEQGHVAYAA